MSGRRKLAVVLVGAIWCAVLLAGVATWLNDLRKPPGRAPSDFVPRVAAAADTRPPSAEAMEELGRRFEQLAVAGDREGLVDLVDWDTLIERAFGDSGYTPEQLATLVAEEREDGGIVEPAVRFVEAGANFSFRKVLEREGRPAALCRVVPHNQMPVFFELIGIERDGRTMVADIYFYVTGELSSQTTRRMTTLALVEPSSEREGERFEANVDVLQHQDQIRALSRGMRESRWTDALAAYDRLPEVLQRDRSFHLLAASAAGQIDEARYVELVEAFEKSHPGDPALMLQKLGYHSAQGDFDEFVAAIKRLDEHVGGDAILKSEWASAELERGNIAEAERVVSLAIDEEPDLPRAHATAVILAVAADDEALAMERIRKFDDRFGASPAGLRSMLADYEEAKPFLESEAFKKWEEEASEAE